MARIVRFQRGLKSRHVSLIALGGIIGSSYFLGTGYVLHQVGPFIFLAYALGGLITFLTMSCLTELCVAVPGPGSFISYARHFVSPTWACGVGWSYWISWVVYIPSECLAAGILMHNFVPHVPIYLWAVLFGIVITLVNLINVKAFGEMEFWLALVKITLLIGFSLLAILIFFDLIGTQKEVFIGDKYLLNDGNPFPNGYAIFFINMVVLLSNFQGSEIIGLSASESQHPKRDIPAALKKIVYRIVGFYLIPTFLLALIFPWQKANLAGSVFADALKSYGLIHLAHVFSFLIIAGALSCANSGLYATVRSLHALATKGMAPKWLSHLNERGVPVKATLVTLAAIWVMLLVSYFFSAHSLYANLLAISGFTGSICWISICWSQLRFRKGLKERLRTYKIPFFPYLTHFAIWLQVICLLIVAISPELRTSFYFGVPMLIIPMLCYHHFVVSQRKKPL
ncbi:MAG: amino acid permease [Simkaniaceae bacterium]|nr:amino acid permease [Simkaniaceae bacterium]